ncbi:hypothetical protein HHL19_10825 [Streptomyces sp. R302]|uniref:hypothetical protein n=1 Tax=unclassified Streptomyces TaxID=2593676 RepID=UPI00145C40B3|nr:MULTISPECIES: hypothetical protein [unclassified Streptomyces]NML50156.1 hypothetical protein [Streptomyces sp. R301]NML79147.1 hypothetical protein [Streptomyces sp. R302]
MCSPQVLAKGDHIAILRDGHLTIERERVVITVPLAAIEEVRRTGATSLTLVLTDGVTRPRTARPGSPGGRYGRASSASSAPTRRTCG